MQISGFEFPDDLYYDKQHNWACVEGNAGADFLCLWSPGSGWDKSLRWLAAKSPPSTRNWSGSPP